MAHALQRYIEEIPELRYFGRVRALIGLLIEVEGLNERAITGSRVEIVLKSGKRIQGEVIGFRDEVSLLLEDLDESD